MKDKNWERVLADVEFAAGAACGANHSSRSNAVDFLGIRRIGGRFTQATEVLSGGLLKRTRFNSSRRREATGTAGWQRAR